MADYQLTQQGPTVQQAINKALEIQGLLDQETAARQAADALLATKTELQGETARAEAAEALLATISSLQAEIDRATGAEGSLQTLIDAIAAKIPSEASSSNQLADKSFVNSSIATSTATFRGTYSSLSELEEVRADENDYGYVTSTDSAGNTLYSRYKYASGNWVFEYALNNSSFTAAEWAAIQSGITSALVSKLSSLPENSALQEALSSKYVKPSTGIPKADLASGVQTSLGKADSAYQKPNTGIPGSDLAGGIAKTKLADGVQSSLDKADSAYQKPGTGIPKTDLSSDVQTSLGKADSALQQHQDISGKADKVANATDGDIALLDSGGNLKESGVSMEDVARKDGSYDSMAVGIAKNLEGRTNVTDSFFERTTGGDAEVANGLAQMTEVGGNSVKFNQLVQNGDFSDGTTGWSQHNSSLSSEEGCIRVTATGSANFGVFQSNILALGVEHKYFAYATVKPSRAIAIAIGTWDNDLFSTVAQGVEQTYKTIASVTPSRAVAQRLCIFCRGLVGEPISEGDYLDVFSFYCIDLTAIFGTDAEIAAALGITTAEITTDAGVAAFEAWLAENVGLRAYYPYNPGSVLNVNMAGIETVGRNLLDPTTGKARILGAYSDVYGNYYGITGTHGAITFTSDMGETSTITPDEDGKFLLEEPGELSVADAGADCCVFLWWDGTQTDYVEHKDEKTYLDVTHIYGKLNGTGDLVRVWPTGVPAFKDLVDRLRIVDGAVVAEREIGEFDMGETTWAATSGGANGYRTNIIATAAAALRLTILCSKYIAKYANEDGCVYPSASTYGAYIVVPMAQDHYSSASDFKTAMSGQMLYYELLTPETYTDLVYQGSAHFEDGTPVTLPMNYNADNWGIERVLPLNTSEALTTAKPELTCKYSIDAVETLNTHADEIEDLYDKNEELDAKKSNKTGDYPGMAVGSAKVLEGTDSKVEDFVFTAPQCADGIAKLNGVRGKSLVWNQLVQNGNFSDGTTGWIVNFGSITASNGVLSYTVTAAPEQQYSERITRPIAATVVGHKYLIGFTINPAKNVKVKATLGGNAGSLDVTAGVWNRYSTIMQETSIGNYVGFWLDIDMVGEVGDVTQIKDVICIDLTLMFGAGNEPTTVAEFEAMFPLPYYAYNAGQIISNKTEAVEVTGRNQWDEEWEVGAINTTTGINESNAQAIRSKNFIQIIPAAAYFHNLSAYSSVAKTYRVYFYNASKSYLSYETVYSNWDSSRWIITTPANAVYMRFSFYQYGTTYNHDICINLSDPSFNGQYEPYKKNTVELNLPTLTGKLNGEGESVVVFSEGMRGAGTAYDKAAGKRGEVVMAEVDLGDLTWVAINAANGRFYAKISDMRYYANSEIGTARICCSKYASDPAASLGQAQGVGVFCNSETDKQVRVCDSSLANFTVDQVKAAMSGVKLVYELAEPLIYELDEGVPETFQAYKGGTLKQLPENGSEPTTAPMVMLATYAIDVIGILAAMPKDYLSAASLDALLALLGSLHNGTITKNWNEQNQKYTFSFTPNS